MKKVLSIILTIIMIFSTGVVSLTASADVGDITFTERESNNSMSTADRIYNNYTVSGTFTSYDIDMFKFVLTDQSKVTITAVSSYSSLAGGIKNSSDNYVVTFTKRGYSGGTYGYSMTKTLSSGTYYILLLDSQNRANPYMFYIEIKTNHTHNYTRQYNDTYHWYECSCGDEYGTTTHYGGTADCQNKAECSICGGEYGDYGSHKGGNATCQNKANCTLCGVEYGDYGEHIGGTANCQVKAQCYLCGVVYGDYGEHTGGAATCTEKATCEICNQEYGDFKAHSASTEIVPATFTSDGNSTTTCTDCHQELSKEVIKKIDSVKLSYTSVTYNGSVKTPNVIVKDSDGKTINSKYYTIEKSSGRKNAGTYKYTVTFKDNYIGSKTLSFKIKPITSGIKVSLSKKTYAYNGKIKTPTVTVKNAAGTKLSTASYTIKYASGRKNVGKYKVTVTLKGNYGGTKTLYFTINPASTKITKITAGKTSLKVNFTKKTTQTSGYQIAYSTSKSFKNPKYKTVSGNKSSSTTLSDLSAKKNYYVMIRTYKTVGGKKYYSVWSSVKSKCTAHTHSYLKATCTSGKKCKYCGVTSTKALGHTNTATCNRCGKVLFKKLTYTGTGIKKIKNINIPEGDFILTVTAEPSIKNEFVYGYCHVYLYNGNGNLMAHCNPCADSDNYYPETKKDTFQGAIKNGYINVNFIGDYTVKWKITIEPY